MLIKINWTDNTDGKCWATTSCKIWHLFCSSSDLPSPSSTTAWITMGNTPRSRSKFSFKRKEASRRKQTSLEFVRFCDVWSSHKLLIRSPTADTYVFLFPLVEINFERRHGELLAHPSLVVHSFRDQRRVLWAVPAHSMRQENSGQRAGRWRNLTGQRSIHSRFSQTFYQKGNTTDGCHI